MFVRIWYFLRSGSIVVLLGGKVFMWHGLLKIRGRIIVIPIAVVANIAATTRHTNDSFRDIVG